MSAAPGGPSISAKTQLGHVTSDLHLFSRWSAANKHIAAIRRAAARSEFFVLNGDVFDFRWTTLPTVDETMSAAVEWLGDFATDHPHCQVHYVMGNHDASARFAEQLKVLAGELGNFEWHPSHVRLGNALFLHGDLVFHLQPESPFERTLAQPMRKRSKAAGHCNRLLHAMRFHTWHAPVCRPKRCANRIIRSFEGDPAGLTAGVTDVYFGHTHRMFTNYRLAGITFHNTGAAIGGIRGNVLPVRVSAVKHGSQRFAG